MPSHKEIVNKILPEFAANLRQEGLIEAYNHKPFAISCFEDYPPIIIRPDLVLILADPPRRLLVEVSNPRDPKRFVGEIACAQLLGIHKLIGGALIFILPAPRLRVEYARLVMRTSMLEAFRSETPVRVMTWLSCARKSNYNNLKETILRDIEGQARRHT